MVAKCHLLNARLPALFHDFHPIMKLFLLWLAAALASSITGCHNHGKHVFCINTDGEEGQISPAPTGKAPASYTGCHNHGSDTYCLDGDNEVNFKIPAKTTEAASAKATDISPEVTGCHFHGKTQFCLDGNGAEGSIVPAPSKTKDAPESYTGCHAHGTSTFCMNGDEEVQFAVEPIEEVADEDKGEMDCHFHAGVEHCIPKGGSENGGHEKQLCDIVERDYNIKLRIGLIFAVLGADFLGVWGPLVVSKFFANAMDGVIVTLIKQFGTGVILSTALVHLMTHAQLMWNNLCITLKYESTATSITMAGIFVSFVVEYLLNRFLITRSSKIDSFLRQNDVSGGSENSDLDDKNPNAIASEHVHEDPEAKAKHDKVALMLLEAGIVFHSVLIGLTLVVAGDSYFMTLFIVILFHQFFEGVALGTRIAEVQSIPLWSKLIMGAVFAVTTPIGMAIGTGVLNTFNGNDFSTIVALGTLDSFSAGILLWVGLIEMLAHDWLHGKLATAGWFHTGVGFFGMIAGMILMSFIGKWA